MTDRSHVTIAGRTIMLMIVLTPPAKWNAERILPKIPLWVDPHFVINRIIWDLYLLYSEQMK